MQDEARPQIELDKNGYTAVGLTVKPKLFVTSPVSHSLKIRDRLKVDRVWEIVTGQL